VGSSVPPNAISDPSSSAFLFNNPNKYLLYDAITQKLSFATEEELIEIRKSKIVCKLKTPLMSRTMDVMLGFGSDRFVGTIELPSKVFWGRMIGWWETLYVIEGCQDV
jgi:hypothetical protein